MKLTSRGLLTTHRAAGPLWDDCILTVCGGTHSSPSHIPTAPDMILQTERERERGGRVGVCELQM